MKKKILGLLLVLALTVGIISGIIVFATPMASADTITPSESLAGEGTEENPYQIGSVADWLYFANYVNSKNGSNSGYFKLTANITFNTGDASTWRTTAPAINLADYGGKSYIIGPECKVNPFVGTFDGNGYTISGVYINKTGGSCGLFGSVAAGKTATIKNLVVTNSYYESDTSGEAGALIGQLSGGTTYIKNVFVTDSVYIKSAGTSDGGLVGHCGANDYGDPTLYMDNCVNGATVDAGSNQYVGGLVGNGNGKQLYINNCLNYGTVIGGTNYLAGLVGRDDKAGSQFNYCVNIGTITPSSGTNYRQIVMSNSSSKKPILTNCLALTTSYGKNTTNTNCAQITKDEFLSEGFLDTTNGQKLGSAWVERASETTNGDVVTKIKEICMPKTLVDVIRKMPKTSLYSEKTRAHVPGWLLEAYENKLVEIDSVEKYKAFADYFNGNSIEVCAGGAEGVTVILTADLSFNNGKSSDWEDAAPANNMTDYIIGNVENPFRGTFDGDGHTISGVYIKQTGMKGSVGLFGSTAAGHTATIKNLVITNSYFESDEQGEVGAVLGQTSGGETYIDCVFVTDSVYIKSAGTCAGGFIGHNGGNGYGNPTIYIDNSVNGAKIDAGEKQYVGGFVGNGNGQFVYINNCLNYGEVSGGSNYVSGFIGRDDKAGSEINNSVNIGTVTATTAANARQFVISTSSSKKPILNNCLAINSSFGRNTEDNDCAVIIAEEFIDTGFLTSAGASIAEDWVELASRNVVDGVETRIYEVCVPTSLKDVVKGSFPKTSFYKKFIREKAPAWLMEAYESGTIEIDTVKKYKEFADFFNGNYAEECENGASGLTVLLTADLSFNTGSASKWGELIPANNMTQYVIGSWENPFRGTFDGNGYTISGFYVKTTKDGVGLFGATAYGEQATIKNFIIKNSYFETSGEAVGAAVGQSHGGETYISNIYVDHDVYIASYKYAGGIMGHLGQGTFETPYVVIESCVNAATVTSTDSAAGGILGNGNQKNVSISNCLNIGDISGAKNVGGIMGFGKGGASVVINIDGCVNAGKISSASSKNEEKACAITSFASTARPNLTAENCYYVRGTATYGVFEGSGESEDGGAFATSLARLSGPDLFGELDPDAWIARGNNDVDPKVLEICIPKGVSAFAPKETHLRGIPVPKWLEKYEEQTVFEIDSVERFEEFAKFVNGFYSESGDFEGKTVMLTADLVFNTGDSQTWGSKAPANNMTDFIVGDNSNPFRGTFDGNQKTISGFYAKKTDSDTVGIFGSTAGGKTTTIKNLVITNSYFESRKGAVGALIGQTSGGSTLIKNIYVTASVAIISADDYVGGLVGHVGQNGYNFIDDTPALIIDSCVNAASITTEKENSAVGGILGNANNKNITIKNCLNMGDIKGGKNVGGILGNGTGGTANCEIFIEACVNVGNVSAESGNAAAIANLSNKGNRNAVNCYYLVGTATYGVYKDGDAEGAYAISMIGLNGGQLAAALSESPWEARNGNIIDDVENGIRTIEGRDIPVPASLADVVGFTSFYDTIRVVIAADGFASGDGTEANPYVINNYAQWQFFADSVNNGETYEGKFIVLCDDIVIDYGYRVYMTTVGTEDNPFIGNFDGQGHSLSGFLFAPVNNGSKLGLFGVIGSGATVKNLVIVKLKVESTESGAGVIASVSTANGSESATVIENIYVAKEVFYESNVSDDWNNVGGILGTVIGENKEDAVIIISNCVFGGTIRSSNKLGKFGVGGIVGNGNGATLHIDNCLNFGYIIGESYTAGIVGMNDGTTYFVKCLNAHMPESEIWDRKVAEFICTVSEDAEVYFENCIYIGIRKTYAENSYIYTKLRDVKKISLSSVFGIDKKVYEGWQTREGDIALPDGVFAFAKDLSSGLRIYKPTEIASVAPVDPNEEWTGVAAKAFAGGSGTEDDPYQIATPAQFAYFAKYVNSGNDTSGKYFELTADITFNTGDASTWLTSFGGINMTSYMVGNGDDSDDKANFRPFQGTFNGNGHVISGWYMSTAQEYGTGLFAIIQDATIKNLVITNSCFKTSERKIAAAVGQMDGTSVVTNIYVTDSVYVQSYKGNRSGVVSTIYDTCNGVISNCVNAANISVVSTKNDDKNYAGGILGNGNSGIVEINDCLNISAISGYRYIGGIAGALNNDDASINRCINIGSVSGNSGYFSEISNAGSSSKYVYFYDCFGTVNKNGRRVDESSTYTKISADEFITAGFLDEDGSELAEIWTALSSSLEIGDTITVTKEVCIPTELYNVIGSITTSYHSVSVMTHAPEWLLDSWGEGTVTITSAEEWIEFAKFFNGEYIEKCDDRMEGKTLNLEADIAFNTGNAAIWGIIAPENDMTGYMIGSWANPFMGTFDGNGYTISGFYGKKAVGEGDTLGIFGSTTYGEESTIQNLVIKNSYFECGDGAVGALIGQIHAGTTYINNIYVDSSVYVVSNGSYAGGIVGHLGQGSFIVPTLYIDSCVNAATVTSTSSSVGGILGNGNQKNYTVTNCLNMGDITGAASVGGIVGYGRGGANVEIIIGECINIGNIASASTKDEEKACAITSMGKTARDNLTSYGCYYLAGTAEYGVFEGSGESEDGGVYVIDDVEAITGVEVDEEITDNLTEWALREGLIMIPKTLVDFDIAAAPEVITPEPPATEPEVESEDEE